MSRMRVACMRLLMVMIAAWMAAVSSVSWAQEEMSYILLDGSLLVDDCMCGRPALFYSMRGTFRLVFRDENTLFKTYDVKDVKFHAGAGDSEYEVTGEGTYQIGGEVALSQRMELSVTVGDLPVVRFLSGEGPLERIPPMIEMKVSERLDPFTIQFFWMYIIAAPVREIWFRPSRASLRALASHPAPEATSFLTSGGSSRRIPSL